MNHPLICIPKINHHANIRIICFPYAGGNSSTYLSWQQKLTPKAELALIQLPGRASRISEQPYEKMTDILNDLFHDFRLLSQKPFILFGHSMGAYIAYEFSLMLHRFQCRLPVQVICSASSAPHIKSHREIFSALPDKEFIEKIRAIGGSPKEVLDNSELMQLLLPTIRSDFKITENYHREINATIPTTISVFAGTNDTINLSEQRAWFDLFGENTGLQFIEGDHFYIDKNREEVILKLNKIINNL